MKTAPFLLALWACLGLIPCAGYADEQREQSNGTRVLKPPRSGHKAPARSETSQTACEARGASAIGNCEKSSTGFGRIFFNRKGRDDSEPDSRQEPPSAAECGCAIAQQCAPSQPQSAQSFREPRISVRGIPARSMGGKCIGGLNKWISYDSHSPIARLLVSSRSQPFCCSARAAWWGQTSRSLRLRRSPITRP